MEGTEEIEPLTHAFNMEIPIGFDKKIFFLTDGDIMSRDSLIDLVKANSSKA